MINSAVIMSLYFHISFCVGLLFKSVSQRELVALSLNYREEMGERTALVPSVRGNTKTL